ncbi:MAG: hypothetical protein Q9175_008267 [Cornicularia normoerica]
MEVELADIHPTPSGHRKFSKDEAVLARFGKRQQLRIDVVGTKFLQSVLALRPSAIPFQLLLSHL